MSGGCVGCIARGAAKKIDSKEGAGGKAKAEELKKNSKLRMEWMEVRPPLLRADVGCLRNKKAVLNLFVE